MNTVCDQVLYINDVAQIYSTILSTSSTKKYKTKEEFIKIQ